MPFADGEAPGGRQQGQAALPGHAAIGSVVFAGKERRRLAKQDASDPAGWRHRGGIDGHLRVETVYQDLEKLRETPALDFVETGLAAMLRQGQALPQPPLHPIVAIVQNL